MVSKVANFAIDLPDAGLLVQVSGTFGSRQEEAQRLGRVLRPKARPARFYTLVSHDTVEQDFAAKRQLFLVEQGYRYEIVPAEGLAERIRCFVTHRSVPCFTRRVEAATRVIGGHDGRQVEDGRRSTVLAAVDGARGARRAGGARAVG